MQVEPVCLQYKWYNWYLIGYHEKHQDYCMFKLIRMEDLRETDIRYTRDHDVSEIKSSGSREKIMHVRLYGKACVRAKCREYLNGRVVQEFENGDFMFCFSAPEHETFWYGAILSFGNHVRIIEPPELKERILKTCREIQAEYGSS